MVALGPDMKPAAFSPAAGFAEFGRHAFSSAAGRHLRPGAALRQASPAAFLHPQRSLSAISAFRGTDVPEDFSSRFRLSAQNAFARWEARRAKATPADLRYRARLKLEEAIRVRRMAPSLSLIIQREMLLAEAARLQAEAEGLEAVAAQLEPEAARATVRRP
jgi:hypothetical protein